MKKTKNYEGFKLMAGNRPIDYQNKARIKASLKKNGWLGGAILVNEKREIVDGQHRFVALKELGMPIVYEVVNGADIMTVQTLNTSQKAWTVKDVIESECALGNQNYIRLKELKESYPWLTYGMLVTMINMSKALGGQTTRSVRERRLDFTEERYNQMKEYCEMLERVRPTIENMTGRKSNMYPAIVWCFDNPRIDNEELISKIEKFLPVITTHIGTSNMVLRDLESCYNRYRRDPIEFYWEARRGKN